MTLHLILMRHAKSALASEHFTDHERPLAPEGREAIQAIASHLSQLGKIPDYIYSSDSLRTRQTTEILVPALGFAPKIVYTSSLYQASAGEVIDFLRLEAKSNCVQLVGHNPAMESLLELLSHQYRPMDPGSVAILQHDTNDWEQALRKAGTWTLAGFISAT
ncbi:MAG: histidine phosphatase family protein [Myxococcaceae bacterium]|nr:histidine phosphatase family protein [Myxococcaceae bacterium]MBH2005981.1 histidine phosphatase family protein [Myxococcaceae bacterium]